MVTKLKFLLSFLKEVENLDIFSLCNEFDKLSLKDNTGASSSSSSTSQSLVQPSSYDYRDTLLRFLRSYTHSHRCQSIINQLRAPFIELPRHYMDSSFKSYDINMGFGFRFLPGLSQFLLQELKMPGSFEKLSFLKRSIIL